MSGKLRIYCINISWSQFFEQSNFSKVVFRKYLQFALHFFPTGQAKILTCGIFIELLPSQKSKHLLFFLNNVSSICLKSSYEWKAKSFDRKKMQIPKKYLYKMINNLDDSKR